MISKILYDLPSTTKFKYQKENRIINALQYFFDEKGIDVAVRIATSCYDDTIIQECFEKNHSKIKDTGLLSIIDNKFPICNYKRMLLYNYWNDLKSHIKMDDFLWDLIERVFGVELVIIEKNLLQSRKDNPTYMMRNTSPFVALEKREKIFILYDPCTHEYYPITDHLE
jgi:hypothetical protein